MDFVLLDKLGRILLPKPLRRQMGLEPGDRLLAIPADGKLLLKKLDAETLLRQAAEELKGVDVDAIVAEVRREAERDARAAAARLLAGRKPLRGRRQAPAAADRKLRAAGRPAG